MNAWVGYCNEEEENQERREEAVKGRKVKGTIGTV